MASLTRGSVLGVLFDWGQETHTERLQECEKIENSRALDTTAYLSFFELLHNGVCLFQKIE